MPAKKVKSKSPVPAILPREQLTKKAKSAIFQYACHKSRKSGMINWLMVTWVLDAERMPRERLYKKLIDWGYVWSPATGFWYTRKELAE